MDAPNVLHAVVEAGNSIPQVETATAERFFTDGCDALTSEPDSRETFVDVPAVGATAAAELPSVVLSTPPPALKGRSFAIDHGPGGSWMVRLFEDGQNMGGGQFPNDDYDEAFEHGQDWCNAGAQEELIGDAPAVPVSAMPGAGFSIELSPRDVLALKEFDRTEAARNRLFSQLLFASRELAEFDIVRLPPTPLEFEGGHRWCRRCQMNEVGGSIPHASSCATGRVLGIIDELLSLADNGGKERGCSCTKPEQPRAEGENSPRGFYLDPRHPANSFCPECGKMNDAWLRRAAVPGMWLATNQVLFDGFIWSHRCSEGGAR